MRTSLAVLGITMLATMPAFAMLYSDEGSTFNYEYSENGRIKIDHEARDDHDLRMLRQHGVDATSVERWGTCIRAHIRRSDGTQKMQYFTPASTRLRGRGRFWLKLCQVAECGDAGAVQRDKGIAICRQLHGRTGQYSALGDRFERGAGMQTGHRDGMSIRGQVEDAEHGAVFDDAAEDQDWLGHIKKCNIA